jgi:hypothetical protein
VPPRQTPWGSVKRRVRMSETDREKALPSEWGRRFGVGYGSARSPSLHENAPSEGRATAVSGQQSQSNGPKSARSLARLNARSEK